MDPVKALHNLADLANAGGATSGDAGVIAVEVVTLADDGFPDKGYSEAIEALSVQYDNGGLRTTDGQPMRNFVPWGGVVELAELACMLARPIRLSGWVNEQAHAASRGDKHDLLWCSELAPTTTIQTERRWKNAAKALAALPANQRDDNHVEQVAHVDRTLDAFKSVDAFAQSLAQTGQGTSSAISQLQEEYAHLMAVPLLSNADRTKEIRHELERLGAAPDEDLVQEVRDQLGVSPPPWEQSGKHGDEER